MFERSLMMQGHPLFAYRRRNWLSFSEWDVMAILGRAYRQYVFLPAQGSRGGILVAWREGSFSADHWRVHRHSVSVKFSTEDQHWWFTGVYGPHQDGEKIGFRTELREVRGHCQGPWIVAGILT